MEGERERRRDQSFDRVRHTEWEQEKNKKTEKEGGKGKEVR